MRDFSKHGLLVVVSSALLLVVVSAGPLEGDTIWKKNGSKVVGKILLEEPQRVQIRMKQGTLEANVWIPRSDILRIEVGLTAEEELEQRLGLLQPDDLAGHKELIAWANKAGLKARAIELEGRLPMIELLRHKKDHPYDWCRPCNATGSVGCKKCEGKGHLIDPCARCDGNGVIVCASCANREAGLLRCRRCAGAGEYERFDPKRGMKVRTKCDDCRGTGDQACPTCEGKRKQTCAGCEGKKGTQRTCDLCGGKPQLKCELCKGSRIQPQPLTKEEYEVEQRAAAAQEAKAKAEREAAEQKAREAKEKLERDAKEKDSDAKEKSGGAPAPNQPTTSACLSRRNDR